MIFQKQLISCYSLVNFDTFLEIKQMDESPIFSLPPGVFFLGLIAVLFSLLFTCIVIGKLCRQFELNREISTMKLEQAKDVRMPLESERPPSYESLLPSYSEAICFNRDVNLYFTVQN
ncbi:unnamed protein product [Larinioides sclopetarius]|uniref:Uncharacterized protein n=1 Tax=Larinioides sclopetarius TaxID=280406 RepID=A0AAV2B9U7_9ARAC